MTLNTASRLILSGNTYGNLPAVRELGAVWNKETKKWSVELSHHPLNTVKRRKELAQMIAALEAKGVRFTLERDRNG